VTDAADDATAAVAVNAATADAGDAGAPAGRYRDLRVVAITDRRRMVPAELLARCALDGGRARAGALDELAAAFAAAIQRALAGCPAGAVAVQVREKDLDGRALVALVRAAQHACAPVGARVIVNDRLDVALATGAFGVQLPERGLPLAAARALAPQLAIGVSRHAAPLDQLAGEGADLVQLGTIWPTPSKPGIATLGPTALAWPHATATLVAVGGIDSPARAQLAAASGADAVAVIRAAWASAQPAASAGSLAAFVAAVERGLAARATPATPR
jgi:thiamine-phosphate pyrophosphorylase